MRKHLKSGVHANRKEQIMRKFRGAISTNVVGSERQFDFEVEDDATEEEIEEVAQMAAFEFIDWYYEEIEDNSNFEIRELISKAFDDANENDMIDVVIRLYISNGDDITIWEDTTGFKFSSGDCSYITLDELLDDLCKEIEDYKYKVTNVEIE